MPSPSDFDTTTPSPDKIAETAKTTIDAAAETAKDLFADLANSIRTSVEEHPTRTVLIAGGFGLAIGALWMTNRYVARNNSLDWSNLPAIRGRVAQSSLARMSCTARL